MVENNEILAGYPIEEFLADHEDRAWNRETLACYSRFLKEIKKYFETHGPLDEESLKRWQEDLHEKDYKERSINTRIAVLNNYLRWCGRYDLVMKHIHACKRDEPVLTRGEYLLLLRTARHMDQHRLYLIIKLFAITGVPVHCLKQVTVELVQQGEGAIHGRGNDLPFECPEGFRQELLAYCKESHIYTGPIFVTRNGQTVSRSNLCRSLQRLSQEAGIREDKVSPRSLRNLCKVAREDIYANIDQMMKQAYAQLLETEDTVVGWQAGA